MKSTKHISIMQNSTSNEGEEIRRSEVGNQVENLIKSSDAIAECVPMLVNRLSAVLRMETEAGKSEDSEEVLLVPLAKELSAIDKRLWASVARLHEIINRVEI
jgi:hypothetical protein